MIEVTYLEKWNEVFTDLVPLAVAESLVETGKKDEWKFLWNGDHNKLYINSLTKTK